MVDTKIREAVGVFHDEKSLQSAVDALLVAGFDRSYVSLLAGQHAIESKLGHHFEKVAELEDDPEVPTQAYVGTDSRTEGKAAIVGGLFYVGAVAAAGMIVASGGTMAAALIAGAVAGGGGGLIGAALAQFLEHRHANRVQTQLDHGGLLLWVRTPAPEDERRAVDILRTHSADDVHVHDLPAPHYEHTGGVSRDMSFMKRLGM
ncbi:MAG: hypothetical protein ACREE7_17780 [Dongiaceae bacterium]